MGNTTDYLEKKLVEGVMGVTSYTTPSEVFLALFTADPTDTGDVTNEVSAAEYNRVSLAGKFDVLGDTSGTLYNTSDIIFAESTTGWGVVTHLGIMLSGTKTTDDMIMYQTASPSRDVVVGKTLEFPTGFFAVQVT